MKLSPSRRTVVIIWFVWALIMIGYQVYVRASLTKRRRVRSAGTMPRDGVIAAASYRERAGAGRGLLGVGLALARAEQQAVSAHAAGRGLDPPGGPPPGERATRVGGDHRVHADQPADQHPGRAADEKGHHRVVHPRPIRAKAMPAQTPVLSRTCRT